MLYIKKTIMFIAILIIGNVFIGNINIVDAHWVTAGDAWYLEETSWPNIAAFAYLGAKHMVTWYDHLLFLIGIIFFLFKKRDIAKYVSLFALWHSSTLLLWVFADININAYLIDAIIGLSVVYKWLDNIGAYKRRFGYQPDTKKATLVFGLFHGFGLATKIQEYSISTNWLFQNLISFNVWVEVWQILWLSAILIIMWFFRKSKYYEKYAYSVNIVLMICWFILMGYQLTGYFYS